MRLHFEYISGGTILIMDDDLGVCLLMKMYFLRKGCKVFITHTLADALRCAKDSMPDAVIITSSCENTGALADDFLAQAPGVQLIACNREIIYEK